MVGECESVRVWELIRKKRMGRDGMEWMMDRHSLGVVEDVWIYFS